MLDPIVTTNTYLSEFTRIKTRLVGHALPWLNTLRENAIQHFAKVGLPTTRHEDWKYTNINPIAKQPFTTAATEPAPIAVELLQDHIIKELDPYVLVFINGHWLATLPKKDPLANQITITSLKSALADPANHLAPYLEKALDTNAHGFTALNQAFFQDGIYIQVPANTQLTRPIQLIFLSNPSTPDIAAYIRNLILIAENSQATIIETYAGIKDQRYLTNTITQIHVGQNSAVTHYKIQRESTHAFHIGTLQLQQARDSRITAFSFALGGALVRSDTNAEQQATGAECSLNGFYFAKGQQHIDHHTCIDHQQPQGKSQEFYKGILAGNSHGVFNGKVIVQKDAQQISAEQKNHNLLLSETATINTKPQLEIYADDVKCAHGATVGQLDEEALFYLCSRGIPQDLARKLLIYAFANDIIDLVPLAPLQSYLKTTLLSYLPEGQDVREML